MMNESQLNKLERMFNTYYIEELETCLTDSELEKDIIEMVNPRSYTDCQILVSSRDIDDEEIEYAVYIDYASFSLIKQVDFCDWDYKEITKLADDLDDFINTLEHFLNFEELYSLNADNEIITEQYKKHLSIATVKGGHQ